MVQSARLTPERVLVRQQLSKLRYGDRAADNLPREFLLDGDQKMKSLILAAGLAIGAAASFTSPALADVDVNLGIGVSPYAYDYYDYRRGPDYRFRDGYGWYRPGVYMPGYNAGRLSCSEARRVVRGSGYRNVDVVDCSGRTYTFEATRNGRPVVVYVNSRNGRIWRG
jgi:hypothetical protein